METVQLELHYHLEGGEHSMDAFVRNKTEAEILAAFIHICDELGISANIESYAFQEGGLKEFWKFIGGNKDQLGYILAIITLIFTRFPTPPGVDPETDKLNKEILRLTIEEKKVSIEKARKEIEEQPKKPKDPESDFERVERNQKVSLRRSNFYKYLSTNDKVKAVGFSSIITKELTTKERIVDRENFSLFILNTDKLPSERIENARIEIVAPVIKEGGYHWRGLYDGHVISFSMHDSQFKAGVLSRQVSFSHGSTIECVLIIHRKIDEMGDIVITGYTVETVIAKGENYQLAETPQGRKYRFEKEHNKRQIELFTPDDQNTA